MRIDIGSQSHHLNLGKDFWTYDSSNLILNISLIHYFIFHQAYEKEIGKEKVLLCKPSPTYITQLFVPLSRFSEETERLVNGANSEYVYLYFK